jgi:Helix-turn-helix domain
VTLLELRATLERRAAEADAEGAQAPVARVYRLVLTELDQVATNGGNGDRAPAPERLLTPAEVAERLGVSLRFVYAHRDQLGGRALSRRALRFPEAALARALARRP